MPQLKQITCCIQWADTGASFQEYGTRYGDGVVESYIIVPNKPQKFTIHLKSFGYIAEGLCTIVFIDGNYQCNRSRLNLVHPKDGDKSRTEVKFLLRQKEKAHGDSMYMGREWRFDDHNIVDDQAQEFKEDHFEDLGTIEVLVLRCKAVRQIDVDYDGSSSGEDSDIMGENPSGEPKFEDSAAQRSTNLPSAAGSHAVSVEEDTGLGMLGLFDGAWDEEMPGLGKSAFWTSSPGEPPVMDVKPAQYGQYDGGRWVWQQWQPPFEDATPIHRYFHQPMQPHNQTPSPKYYSQNHRENGYNSSPPPQHFESAPQYYHERPEFRSGKQVRFDFGDHAEPGYPGVQDHLRPMSAARERTTPRHLKLPNYNHNSTQAGSYESQQFSAPNAHRNLSQASRSNNTSQSRTRMPQQNSHIHNNVTRPSSRTGSVPSINLPPKRDPQMRTASHRGNDNASVSGTQATNHTHISSPQQANPSVYDERQPQEDEPSDTNQTYPTQIPIHTAGLAEQACYFPMHHAVPQQPPYFFAAVGAPNYRPGYPYPTYAQPPTQYPGAYGHWTLPVGPGGPNWYMQPLMRPQNYSDSLVSRQVSPKTRTGNSHNGAGQTDQDEDSSHAQKMTDSNIQVNQWTNTDINGSSYDNAQADNKNDGGVNSADRNSWNDNASNDAGTGNDWQQETSDNNNTGFDDWMNSNNNHNTSTNNWDNSKDSKSNDCQWQSTTADQVTANSNSAPQATTIKTGRDLYGPFGPYYAVRAADQDEPKPDAEEEPRYDVPLKLARSYDSTKQVQPGPGYRYFKKSHKPEYLDDLSQPYARFVFKYRTKEQLEREIGVKVDVEPSSDQEIRNLQDMSKEDLIQMLLRAKSGLGGKIPSPPETPPSRDDGILQPRFLNRPDVSFLRYEALIPEPRPTMSQMEPTPISATQDWGASGWDGAKPESIKPPSKPPSVKSTQPSSQDATVQKSAPQQDTTKERNETSAAQSSNQSQPLDGQKSELAVNVPWTDPPRPQPAEKQPTDADWNAHTFAATDTNANGGW